MGEIEVNTFNSPRALDDFDINIIDFRDENLWRYKGANTGSVDCINDFKSLKKIIKNTQNSKIVVIYPQNVTYKYCLPIRNSGYSLQCKLKDILELLGYVLGEALPHLLQIAYANTISNVSGKEVSAAFYFDNLCQNEEVVLRSEGSKYPVCVLSGDIYFTTLDIPENGMIDFLREINLVQDKLQVPSWMEEIQMFDDMKQFDIIRNNQQIIREAEICIDKANEIIAQNNKFKSILYTNGDDLVKVVFEILETMLGVNLEGFEDKKKEDFKFDIDGIIYLGEIKGIGSNVKSQNITQLELHHQSYVDDHQDISDDELRMILIVNHQRGIPLFSREPVDQKQIDLACKYGSLIVESYTLLKMYEKYLNADITREQCIDMLTSNTGLLII
ncbi:hypothetical protein [Frisingicoccus sp.]|uniref:hypothetical protein n=1 Tax=Frisingicoccus sp. TaxID=1918627 RepID=UPI003AB32E97